MVTFQKRHSDVEKVLMTLDSPKSMHAPSMEHIKKYTLFRIREDGGLAKFLSNEKEGCNKGFLDGKKVYGKSSRTLQVSSTRINRWGLSKLTIGNKTE